MSINTSRPIRFIACLISLTFLSFTLFSPPVVAQAYYVHLAAAATFAPSLPRDPTTTFVYDGDGGRVKKITATGTTKFLGQSVEIAPDGTITKYLFAGSQRLAAIETPPGKLVSLPRQTAPPSLFATLGHALTSLLAWIIPEAEAALAPSAMKFYHPDHVGSTNLVTDGTGAVIEVTENTPFGSIACHDGPANVPYKFTGQLQDTTNGLILFPARAYDPQLGRFTQPDTVVQNPADPQALNRYSYVRNNPVNLVDPSGHFFFLAFLGALLVKAAIGAAVGAALNATVAAFTGGNVGKAALVGAVGGAIFGAGGAITGLSAFQGATTAAIVGRATVMGSAGALAGLSGAGMTGQPLGRGAGIGAVLGVLGVVAPTPNVPWLGYGPVAERINPILNSMLSGAVLGGGVAAIQGENIGRGALGGAIYTGLGTAFQIGAQSLFPPSNAGFAEEPTSFTLQRGTVLSRIGDTNGRYLAPVGTTVEERALPIYARNRPYHVYEVRKEFEVDMGKAASAYGQSGQGIQYRSERTVQQLIDEGYLALADPRK